MNNPLGRFNGGIQVRYIWSIYIYFIHGGTSNIWQYDPIVSISDPYLIHISTIGGTPNAMIHTGLMNPLRRPLQGSAWAKPLRWDFSLANRNWRLKGGYLGKSYKFREYSGKLFRFAILRDSKNEDWSHWIGSGCSFLTGNIGNHGFYMFFTLKSRVFPSFFRWNQSNDLKYRHADRLGDLEVNGSCVLPSMGECIMGCSKRHVDRHVQIQINLKQPRFINDGQYFHVRHDGSASWFASMSHSSRLRQSSCGLW